MGNDMITVGAVMIAGLALLIIYFGFMYWVISTVLLMIYPIATTLQKIAVTFLVTCVLGMFKSTVTVKK